MVNPTPDEIIARATESELLGFHKNASRLYESYTLLRPEFSSLYAGSISRCKRQAVSCGMLSDVSTDLQLSIIIPVYNSAKYLRQCIFSVQNQLNNDIEIIIINDGSTDESGSIIEELASADNRLKVITNRIPSGSPGIPRNQGLRQAKGMYIGFVDSDDWVGPSYFQTLIQTAIENNAEIAIAEGFINHITDSRHDQRIYKNYFFGKDQGPISTYHPSSMIWDKVYSRELLTNNAIYLGAGEAAVDVLFNLKAYYYARNIVSAPTTGYHYRRETENSVTVHQRKNTKCSFELKAYRDAWEWCARDHVDRRYLPYIRIKQLSSFVYTCRIINVDYLQDYFLECCRVVSKIDSDDFSEALSHSHCGFMKDDALIFTQSDLNAFIQKYRPADASLFIQSRKYVLPKSLINLSQSFGSANSRGTRIVFAPDWSFSNPYQRLFYESLARLHGCQALGLDVNDLTAKNIIDLLPESGVLHLHWIHPFYQGKNNPAHFLQILSDVKRNGIRLYWTVHNLYPHGSLRETSEREIRRTVASLCDGIICHSSKAFQLLVDEFDVDIRKVCLIPHGKYVPAIRDEQMQSLSSSNCKSARLKLGIFGDLKDYKNIEWASSVVAEFNQDKVHSEQIELHVYGDPLTEPRAIWIQKMCQLHDWFLCMPKRLSESELAKAMHDIDFVFIPYKEMLTSGIALNAISHLRPFIAQKHEIFDGIGGSSCRAHYADKASLLVLLAELSALKSNGLLQAVYAESNIKKETANLCWDSLLKSFSY